MNPARHLPAQAAQPAYDALKGSAVGGRADSAVTGDESAACCKQNKVVPGSEAFTMKRIAARWKFARQARWIKDPDGFNKRADQKFPELLQK